MPSKQPQAGGLAGIGTAYTVYPAGTLPRPPRVNPPDGVLYPEAPPVKPPDGFGQRSIWHLPPVGEAARRDPHVPDPYPGGSRDISQAVIDPPVQRAGRWHSGGGIDAYPGIATALTYAKILGTAMTRNLGIEFRSGWLESRWRLGGISYPADYGFGPGYHGDAQTLWYDNPQTYLRNPGVIPLTNNPATWRYAPGGNIQPVGPSIADVGNLTPVPGTP